MARIAVVLVVALARPAFGQAAPDSFDPAGDAPRAARAGRGRAGGATASKIDRVVESYVALHAEHLKARHAMSRAMAAIGLAAVDHPRAVEKLLEVATRDASPAVRVFAWECLHAHNRSLTAAQRGQWLQAGRNLATKGALRGDLRPPLLELAADDGPTRPNRAIFARMFATTNLTYGPDTLTLRAMRSTLAKWKDQTLAKKLILATTRLDDAYRAEYLLGGLARGVSPATTDSKLGSTAMWQRAQERYAKWLKEADLKPAGKRPLSYRGVSPFLPRPARVTDPTNPKWSKRLELPRFELDQIDVTFVVDSTGSMEKAIHWLRQDVLRMMRACGMISKRPRIGVVFYRDHGDEYVVRPLKLTGNAMALFRAIGEVTAKGGGDVPEAVYEGLACAILKQQWSSGPRAHKAVVLLGDAPPHPETLGKIRELVQSAAKKGFHLHCVKAWTQYGSRDLASFDRIAKWGGGQSVSAGFGYGGSTPSGRGMVSAPVGRVTMAYGPGGSGSADRVTNRIVAEILRSAVTKEYQGRVKPFVDILVEYVSTPVPERHRSFGPHRPHTGKGRGRGPGQHRPQPPYDPQRR